jgi:hypothetical protein
VDSIDIYQNHGIKSEADYQQIIGPKRFLSHAWCEHNISKTSSGQSLAVWRQQNRERRIFITLFFNHVLVKWYQLGIVLAAGINRCVLLFTVWHIERYIYFLP